MDWLTPAAIAALIGAAAAMLTALDARRRTISGAGLDKAQAVDLIEQASGRAVARAEDSARKLEERLNLAMSRIDALETEVVMLRGENIRLRKRVRHLEDGVSVLSEQLRKAGQAPVWQPEPETNNDPPVLSPAVDSPRE